MIQDSCTDLQLKAHSLAGGIPALVARAEALATSFHTGAHGRKKAGGDEDFWQYRRAETFEARRIDWRRSARSDEHFVQDKEWQVAQNIWLHVDQADSMDFASAEVSKKQRAQELALALGLLLLRGGERVGVWGAGRARAGDDALAPLACELCRAMPENHAPKSPSSTGIVVWISDFLREKEQLEAEVSRMSAHPYRTVLLQILDPAEQDFPFKGRHIFETASGDISFETRDANALRDTYLMKLRERQNMVADVARQKGWLFQTYCTATSARAGLLRLWYGLGSHM